MTGRVLPKELHDLLVAAGVKVWFSEKDLGLGVPMMRAIDKGLAASKIGLVLVTPALLARLPKEGVADKELSTLLQGNRLVPIVHGTTYSALRDVSPMLASRSGLDTSEDDNVGRCNQDCRTGRHLELIELAAEASARPLRLGWLTRKHYGKSTASRLGGESGPPRDHGVGCRGLHRDLRVAGIDGRHGREAAQETGPASEECHGPGIAGCNHPCARCVATPIEGLRTGTKLAQWHSNFSDLQSLAVNNKVP